MKIYAALIIPFLFSAGCATFPVEIKEDLFRGVTTVRADMWHTVLDSRVDNTRVLYEKTIESGRVADPIVSFEFVAMLDPYYYNYHGEPLRPDAYVLVNKKSYTVGLFDIYKSLYDIPMVSGGFLWGFPFPYQGAIIVGHSTRYVLKAKMRLTPDIQQAILAADSYQVRLYTGDEPITLEATPKQLEAVKKFLMTGAVPAPAGDR
jgi:hypothetical protein